jgi:hypothetical protein
MARGETPHDTLFHFAFADPEVARAELEAVLPQAVCARLALDEMVQITSRTASSRLGNLFTDVLYRVPVRGDDAVFVWFLIEHQSGVDRLMPFRVLQYEVDRWATHLRSKLGRARGRLPMVLPVVILHDPRGRQLPARLSELYDGPPELVALLRPLLPDFTYIVDDLPAQSDDDLGRRSNSAVYQLTLWLLRARGELAPERFGALHAAFERLAAEEKWAFAEAFLVYAMQTSAGPDPVAFQAARAASPRLKERVMGIWQEKIEAGRAEGLAEGAQLGAVQGRAAMLLEQLAERFGPVPAEAVQRVDSASPETLRRWGLRLLGAQTLSEVFEDA